MGPKKANLLKSSTNMDNSNDKGKYCSYHKYTNHTSKECWVLKRQREGKEIKPTKCKLCHTEGHHWKECPHAGECVDMDKHGKFVRKRWCFNCGTRADHPPVKCNYKMSTWRIYTNEQAFWKCLDDGTQYQPVLFTPPTELKGGHQASAHVAHDTDNTTIATPTKHRQYWSLIVTGPSEWTESETDTLNDRIEHDAELETRDKEVHITFESEMHVTAAYDALQGALGANGDAYTLQRASQNISPPKASSSAAIVPAQSMEPTSVGCSVLGRGAEPPQFWVLLIWLEPGITCYMGAL